MRIKLLIALVLGALLPAPAFAETGVLMGTFLFIQANGNFCPSNQNCVGTWYPQAAFNTEMPVSNAKVYVLDASVPANRPIIGEGRSDDTGAWLAGWDTNGAPAPSMIEVIVTATQADGRFGINNAAGQYINATVGAFPPMLGTTLFAPQVLDPAVVGTVALPDDFFNSYWAGEWVWRTVMQGAGSAQANFTNVEVRGFQDTIPGFLTAAGFHPTSAASGAQKRLQLDSNAAFSPQARMMHELGHIANYIAHPFNMAMVYDWVQGAATPVKIIPNPGPWGYDGAEWGAVSFEEAFATHYGSIAFWALNSEVPVSCWAARGFTCYLPDPVTGARDMLINTASTLEASSNVGSNNCSTNPVNPEDRWPLTAMRYFWDIFDDHDEGGDAYSAGNGTFWQHLAVLAAYKDGMGPNEIDEPWDASTPDVTEPDGRACASYEANFQAFTGDSTAAQRTMNCTPF